MKFLKRFLGAIASLLLIFVFLLVVTYRKSIPVEELKKTYCDEQSQFVNINGTETHYKIEGQGDTLILIHGTAASLHTWDDWTAELKKDFTIVRMDIPAFGITGPNAERDYSIEAYVDFLHAFAETKGLDNFHLAGNSLGGNIAWNYALSHPEQVNKLVLIDAAGYPIEDGISFIFKLAKTPVLNTIVKYCTPKFFIRRNIREVYAKDELISDELIDRYYALNRRTGNRQAFIDRANTDTETSPERIKEIEHETLIMWGDSDLWIPLEHAQRFKIDIPNSELQIIDNSGHVPMEEDPEITSELVREFLKSTK